MQYNTARPQLKISEYGRNVQEMVQHIKTLPTKEERTKAAHAVINIMINLNPALKEQSEYRQKLWDHLFIIGGYDLDVESPYPAPTPPEMLPAPYKPSYASNHIRFRFYGKNVEKLVAKAMEMEEGPQKDAFVNALASFMKMAHRVWNEDKVPDEQIMEHMRLLSGGKIIMTQINEFAAHNENFNPKPRRDSNQNRPHNRNNKNQNQKKNFRKN
jgi:hypothetical protein